MLTRDSEIDSNRKAPRKFLAPFFCDPSGYLVAGQELRRIAKSSSTVTLRMQRSDRVFRSRFLPTGFQVSATYIL